MAQIILNVKLNNVLAKNQLKELQSAIQQIGDSLSNVKVNRNLTSQINALTKQYTALAKAAQTVAKADMKQAIEAQKYVKERAKATTALINEKKAEEQLNIVKLREEQLTKKLTETTNKNTEAVKKSTKSNLENRQSILSMAQGFLQWQLAAMVVMKPLNLIRQAWASINETLQKTEDAVIALQRVLPSGSASDQDVANKLYDLAQKYGQTFENASAIATNFARTGMSWADTIKATESALLALNVAELDATQASDGMIAIMQQFGLEASDLTDIVDKLNKTADNYAVTTDKLLTALQRTGSSAKNANLTLEETLGLITGLSQATGRSGQNLGTAVNSLIQYSSKSGSLDIFASLDERTSDVVGRYRKGAATILDVWQEVSRVINTMDSRQESILSGLINDDDIKNLETELQDELGDIFETVSDVYGTANTFRKNYFIALLGNMQTVNDAISTAQDAQGYSQKENEKYLDSYTAKVNALQAQWQKLANDEQGLLGIKKQLIDIANPLLKIIEYTGGLKTTLVAISSILATIFAKKLASGIEKLSAGLQNLRAAMKKTEGAAMSLNAKLGIIGLIATAIQAIVGGISKAISDAEEARKKAEEELAEANAKAVETSLNNVSVYKELAQESENYATKLKDLRAILDDVSSTEEQKKSAQDELLSIQNLLIESNKEYASSLDLINGSLNEQVNLVKQISEERLRQQAQQYLDENKANIATAKNLLTGSTQSKTDTILKGNAIDRDKFRNMINAAIAAAGVSDIVSLDQYENFGYYQTVGEDTWDKLSSGDVLGALFTRLTSAFQGKSWVGETKSGIALQGTTEQKLDAIKKIREALNLNYESMGFSIEETNLFSAALSELEKSLNTEAYQNANKLVDTAKLYEDFLNGAIDKAQFLKEVYGIEMVDATETWEEQSSKVLSNYQDILDTVNKMLNAQQSILDVEEKKKALEDARNNLNTRVFNATTGKWELQADQKAIDKAEKDYKNAVWNNLQNEIKDGNLTVGEIFDKVKEISEDLPNLANIIRDALIQDGYNVPAFDNGGVLHGLGGIKATMGDEIVLPPSIAHKILQPTSNEQFSQFCKDLGLLFGASNRVMDMKNGMVMNRNISSDNSVNNSNNSYVVNGVPFSKETAEKHTLVELFEMAADFQN